MDISSLSDALSSSPAIPGDIKSVLLMKDALMQEQVSIAMMKKVMDTQQEVSGTLLQMLGKTVPSNSDAMKIDVYV